jgi:hypothetical protein
MSHLSVDEKTGRQLAKRQVVSAEKTKEKGTILTP